MFDSQALSSGTLETDKGVTNPSHESVSFDTSVVVFLVAYGLIASAAVWVDLFYFADGAYYAFAIATGHPWDLVWSDLPRRLGALCLTGVPAWLVQIAGGPFRIVGKVYQISFYAVPVIALALIRFLVLPKSARLWQNWLVISFATLGAGCLGFTAETWITLALVWPAIASISCPPRGILRRGCAFIVASLFCFSHEAAALCGLVFLFAFYYSWKECDYSDRKYLTYLLAWYVVNGLCWIGLMIWFHPTNSMIAKALKGNQIHLWSFEFLNAPLIFFGVIMSAVSVFLTSRPHSLRNPAPRIAICVFAASIVVLSLALDRPFYRYLGRTAITLLLPALTLSVVLLRRYPAWKTAQWIMLPTLVVHMLVLGNGIAGWTIYRASLVQTVTKPESAIDGNAWRTLVGRTLPHRARYYWGWTSPYTSIMLTDPSKSNGSGIIMDEDWYVPMTCKNAGLYLSNVEWIRRDIANLIIKDICLKNPEQGLAGFGLKAAGSGQSLKVPARESGGQRTLERQSEGLPGKLQFCTNLTLNPL